MAVQQILNHTIRRYSQQAQHDPYLRIKAMAMGGYLVSAFTIPFVPPLLETRRSKKDGTNLTK